MPPTTIPYAAFPCPFLGCRKRCKTERGLDLHYIHAHTVPVDLQPPLLPHRVPQPPHNDPQPPHNYFNDDQPPQDAFEDNPYDQDPPRPPNISYTRDGLRIERHPILDGT
ncbi:hypothetical protein H0H92_010736 [Tricholoma furcatifolium]|nr:hypothetical protein H0H92_010736 [Tricholoma furcatifolium]